MASRGPSEAEKARISSTCQRFIDEVLKPRFLPQIRAKEFNYPIDIRGRWHGQRYRFLQRYRSGFPENLGEEFDAPFAALEWTGPDRFIIQWRRHNDTWWPLYRGKSLAEALQILETDGHLHPL